MNNLGPRLKKFEGLKPADQDIKELIAETIFKHTGVPILPKDMRLSHFVVYLQNPIGRREVFLKKTKILTELTEILDKKAPKDIL